MMRLSIFDLDRTLSRKPTYSLFLLFAMRRLAPWRALLLPVLVPVGIAYAVRVISRERMKEAMHRVALGPEVPLTKAQEVAEAYAERLWRTGLYPQALAQIEAERSAGRRVMLATAAPVLYVAPLAQRLGVKDIVATAGSCREGFLTHQIAGANCYGATKLEMISEALAQEGIDRRSTHVRFFTDHASDSAVCEWADEAYAVNPSPGLRELAKRRAWQILDWRSA